jgi:hypothetical protein
MINENVMLLELEKQFLSKERHELALNFFEKIEKKINDLDNINRTILILNKVWNNFLEKKKINNINSKKRDSNFDKLAAINNSISRFFIIYCNISGIEYTLLTTNDKIKIIRTFPILKKLFEFKNNSF